MAPTSRAALLELLLIFVLVWAALAAYAFFPRALRLGRWQIEQSDIRHHLSPEPVHAAPIVPDVVSQPVRMDAEPATANAAPIAGPSAQPTAVPEAPGRPIDRSPQRILMFGDSMIDELMLKMADYCLENGHQLKPAIWYASTTGQWASHDKLQTLLSRYDPTFVIVVMGSTELTSRGIERRRPAIEAIKHRLNGRPFVWIGPPNWTQDTGINALIERVVGKERFFRSAELSLARKRDGIHPNREASARWMDRVAEWIMRDSAHPIVLDKPSREAPRPRARIFAPE